MATMDASFARISFANMVHDVEQETIVKFYYDLSKNDTYIRIVKIHVWYFGSGASNHSTSHYDFFSSLEIVLAD